MIHDDPTPCYGKAELFDSLYPSDHEEAKKLCDTCPALAACRTHLDKVRAESHHGAGPEGTWAGQLVGTPAARATKNNAAERKAQEARYTNDDVLKAHTQYNNGIRTEWALIGHRIYERQRSRRRKAQRDAA